MPGTSSVATLQRATSPLGAFSLPVLPADPRDWGLLPVVSLDNVVEPPFILIDTEGTGLPHQPWAAVVEIGALAVDATGRVVSAFETLVRWPAPGVVGDQRAGPAFRIHRIDRQDLLAAPSPVDAWYRFCAWSHGLSLWRERSASGRLGPLVSGWNHTYDKRLIDRTFSEPVGGPVLDTMPWGPDIKQGARDAHPRGAKTFHCEDVAQRFGVLPAGQRQAHRALADCVVEYGVWWCLWSLGRR